MLNNQAAAMQLMFRQNISRQKMQICTKRKKLLFIFTVYNQTYINKTAAILRNYYVELYYDAELSCGLCAKLCGKTQLVFYFQIPRIIH